VLIYRPQRRDPAFKYIAYRLALHNPVYCLTLVAQAHMAIIKHGTVPLEPVNDYLTGLVYTRLLKLTRAGVESSKLEEIDVLLLAIVALCEYDLLLDQYDALSSHHVTMSALVSKRGGIHNLGLSMPYVQQMDHFLALRLNRLPLFASPELPTSSVVMRNLTGNLVYGSNLDHSHSGFSDDVLSFCTDAAQLLELMDELNVTFEPSELPGVLVPKLEYFYFLRDNIDTRHTFLNHQRSIAYTGINKDLMALTATKIVIYYITFANSLPMVTSLLATRLWNLLLKAPSVVSLSPWGGTPEPEHSGSHTSYVPTINLSDWTDDMQILLWLLFACALPGSRARCLTFAGHVKSRCTSPDVSRSSRGLENSSQPLEISVTTPSCRKPIMSPSSPRRHRYLSTFLLHVAEHLIGERPFSGTADWDKAVTDILQGFVWPGHRLRTEFESIIGRIHEHVLARSDEYA